MKCVLRNRLPLAGDRSLRQTGEVEVHDSSGNQTQDTLWDDLNTWLFPLVLPGRIALFEGSLGFCCKEPAQACQPLAPAVASSFRITARLVSGTSLLSRAKRRAVQPFLFRAFTSAPFLIREATISKDPS